MSRATARFTVVVPTHDRRERVVRNVAALERQTLRDFEVVVVDDGSRDGSAAVLHDLETSFSLVVIEQANGGAAKARNVGARAAAGELLLFLDDDMEADPALLAEHDRSHREGADLVVGDMPLQPDSPPGLLSWGVGFWAASRRDRLTAPGAEPGLDDLLTGQMSISRDAFEGIGGFDTSFTREGLFGGEDIDFGYRVVQAGLRVAYSTTTSAPPTTCAAPARPAAPSRSWSKSTPSRRGAWPRRRASTRGGAAGRSGR
jgi:GT2 family glycosyltransferase